MTTTRRLASVTTAAALNGALVAVTSAALDLPHVWPGAAFAFLFTFTALNFIWRRYR